jgi:DNA-binding response OmpR family regulator
MALELKPQVVLCDIGLPDVNGYEVARTLRSDPSLRSTRLIAVTGYAQYEDKQKAIDAGFDAHLTKPPDVDKLKKLLTEAATTTEDVRGRYLDEVRTLSRRHALVPWSVEPPRGARRPCDAMTC